jgi:hypothetical protein
MVWREPSPDNVLMESKVLNIKIQPGKFTNVTGLHGIGIYIPLTVGMEDPRLSAIENRLHSWWVGQTECAPSVNMELVCDASLNKD